MGFYGNITNTSNTTFVFDKIYSNRREMEAKMANDGIFIGRYVLIEYDKDANYPVIYTDGASFYSSPKFEKGTKIKFQSGSRPVNQTQTQDVFYTGEFGQVQKFVLDDQNKPTKEIDEITFYQCTGGDTYATFELIAKTGSNNKYIHNFAIDEDMYGANSSGFKGYDSTVWTKVSEKDSDGKLISKYVQIADLNSVVPTFDIAADAPTMTPITPHFDADSTNVYYKLHMQSPYGFRVKQGVEGKSDDSTVWYKTTYIKDADQTKTEKVYEGLADIYYNKAGFNPEVPSKVPNEAKDNYIKLEPTGESGTEYAHGGKAKDIQEFSLHLPAIGNMMSDAWDIIHGPLRNDDMRQYLTNEEGKMLDKDGNITADESKAVKVDSLQGRLNSIAAIEKNQIPIKRINDGQLVGTKINGGTHSTITDNFDASIIQDNFTQDDAWIKTQVNANNTPNAISIHHTFNSTPDSTSQVDKNDNTKNQGGENYKEVYLKNKTNVIEEHQDKIKLYTPYVDAAGHVVGENIETVTLPYGYKTFTTQGLAPLDNENRENVEDLYTTINNQTDGNNTSSSSASGSRSVADNTQDSIAIEPYNKWIQTQLSDDKLVIAHEIHAINTEKNTTNLNDLKDNKIQNEINIPDWDYDEAGHIKKKGEHIYTLPYGFKTIKVENSDSVLGAPFHIGEAKETATNTQDDLKFTASNRWIKMMPTGENDIEFGHILSPIAPEEYERIKLNSILHKSTDTNISEFGGSFNILNFTTDNAGHIIGVGEDIITIPDGSYTPADIATTHTDIITSIGFTPRTGAITSTKANTNTLILYNYSANSGNLDIKATDTINDGLKKVQNHINGLDMSSTSTTEFITEIAQIDGQVAVKRAKAGTLELGTDSTEKTVLGTDSLNQAINKIEARIKAEEENRKNAINTLYGNNGEKIAETFDTIKEIADFLEQEDNDKQSGVEKIISNINTNAYNIAQEKLRAESAETALSTNLTKEIARATNAESANTNLINQETSRAQNKENEIVNNLNNEISRATEEEGKLNTRIDNLVGNTKVSTQIDNKINTFNSTLGSAAFTESSAYVDATTYANKIKELEDRIKELEDKLNPEPETPVEGE